MTDKVVVLSTCASAEEADKIARRLVELRLAACVAITPGIGSLYQWNGAVEGSAEYGLTMKTRRDLFPALCEELRRIHSYEVPEILALPVIDGSADYLAWMDGELAPASQPGATG